MQQTYSKANPMQTQLGTPHEAPHIYPSTGDR